MGTQPLLPSEVNPAPQTQVNWPGLLGLAVRTLPGGQLESGTQTLPGA